MGVFCCPHSCICLCDSTMLIEAWPLTLQLQPGSVPIHVSVCIMCTSLVEAQPLTLHWPPVTAKYGACHLDIHCPADLIGMICNTVHVTELRVVALQHHLLCAMYGGMLNLLGLAPSDFQIASFPTAVQASHSLMTGKCYPSPERSGAKDQEYFDAHLTSI